MDATETEGRKDAPPRRRHRRDETSRAAAYLDLWERHLALAAVQGPDPTPPPTARPGSGA